MVGGPVGRAGRRGLASIFLLTGTPLARVRRERLRGLARGLLPGYGEPGAADAQPVYAGVTSPQPQVIVLRALAPVVEPALLLLRRVWSAWRRELWQMDGESPRIWNT